MRGEKSGFGIERTGNDRFANVVFQKFWSISIFALAAIPSVCFSQFSYEVQIVNRQRHALEVEQACINSSVCSSGRLEPRHSLWLSQPSVIPEERLIITVRIKGLLSTLESSSEISNPKSRCAYEILLKPDGSIVSKKDRLDCINF